MENNYYNEIPSLDLADFTSRGTEKKLSFVADLGNAYNQIGFVAIRNHFLSEQLSAQLYDIFKQFFALPDHIKQSYEIASLAGQRGYVGKGKEHAKGRNTGDLKEFYHVGQILDDNDPLTLEYPANIWPKELPKMKTVATEAYKQLEKTGVEMLRAIALYLGLEENYFDSRVIGGNTILRSIHYFPIEDPDSIPPDAVRAAEHGDINLITILMGASAEGLQVLRHDGKWIDITALPSQVVVNVGDMLERLTNKKLKSTIHRVVNPPKHKMNTSRYSIPFFLHPRREVSLACLPGCIDNQHPKLWEDITAGQFLDQRLAEIGLKK